MKKNKLDLKINVFSWEKKSFKKCDKTDCKAKGEFRAPKSRVTLNQYYFFCLKHVKEYNKSWDFYKGLSVNQIENSMREDVIWNRPSWPLKGNPQKIIDQINNFFNEDFNEISSDRNSFDYFKNRIIDEKLSVDENKAIQVLNLSLPLDLAKIKKNYKKLVKIFHPDVNDNNKIAEEKFKEINKSYRILLKKIKNE